MFTVWFAGSSEDLNQVGLRMKVLSFVGVNEDREIYSKECWTRMLRHRRAVSRLLLDYYEAQVA